MGRKPSRWAHLPPRMRARERGAKIWYYYDHGGRPRRETPLGSDYIQACARWAELERGTAKATPAVPTFADACAAYQREDLPRLADKSQTDYQYAIRRLLTWFNDPPAPLDAIQPRHWEQYAKPRPAVAATRERAVFAAVWRRAVLAGYTTAPCPAAAWRGTTSRRRYSMAQDVYDAIAAAGDQVLRDAMALAYLTGQRPADVLAMDRTDIRDGHLWVEQGKTGERVRIEITGELAALVQRLTRAPDDGVVLSLSLLTNERGRPLTRGSLRTRFDNAREAAAKVARQAHRDDLAALIEAAQFRDLRAKSATDDEAGAQHRLGHTTPQTTAIYIRNVAGRKARPTR